MSNHTIGRFAKAHLTIPRRLVTSILRIDSDAPGARDAVLEAAVAAVGPQDTEGRTAHATLKAALLLSGEELATMSRMLGSEDPETRAQILWVHRHRQSGTARFLWPGRGTRPQLGLAPADLVDRVRAAMPAACSERSAPFLTGIRVVTPAQINGTTPLDPGALIEDVVREQWAPYDAVIDSAQYLRHAYVYEPLRRQDTLGQVRVSAAKEAGLSGILDLLQEVEASHGVVGTSLTRTWMSWLHGVLLSLAPPPGEPWSHAVPRYQWDILVRDLALQGVLVAGVAYAPGRAPKFQWELQYNCINNHWKNRKMAAMSPSGNARELVVIAAG